MTRMICLRLLSAIPLMFGVSLLIFLLGSLVPGDAAQTILGEGATPQALAALQAQMGLDRPWYERYGDWLIKAVHGDLGVSIFTGEPVISALNARIGVSLSLIALALLVSAVFGIALGMVSALRGGLIGRVLDVLALMFLALPSFWVAVVLVSIFAVQLHLLPATGYVPVSVSPMGWLSSMVLPAAALSFLGIAAVAKQTRDSVLDVLQADFIQVLRANGVPERSIIFRHILRNAAIPVVSVLGVVSIGMLGSTVFVESVFVLPGLGSRATQATLDHDASVILGIGVYFTAIVIAINLIVDILYGLLNPRVRAS